MKRLYFLFFFLALANRIFAQFVAEITKTWVEVNAVENGTVGVYFHFNARVVGVGNTTLYVLASIDNPPGCGITDNNGSYRLANGVIGNATKLLTGSGQGTIYFNDAKIWIPISELQVPNGTAQTLYVHYAMVMDDDPLIKFNGSNVLQWTDFTKFTVVGTGSPSQNNRRGNSQPQLHSIVCPGCGGAGRLSWVGDGTTICRTCGGVGLLYNYQ